MANTASKVINIALAEVGYLEKKTNEQLDKKTANAGYNNWNKYARDLDKIPDFYNGKKNGYFWCDIFVDWCFYKAFGIEEARKLLNQPLKSAGAGCTYSAGYFKKKNRLFTTPVRGDQAFFTSDGGKTFYHTGIVTKVDKTYVHLVEGNTSGGNGVVANGGGVFEKKYKLTNKNIYYGRPEYDPEETIKTEVKENKEEPKKEEKGNIVYCAYSSSRWWPDVTNYNTKNGDGYAGITNKAIQGLRIEATDRDIYYRVHTVGGKWLGTVKNRDGKGANSYAGIYGKNIDGVQIRTTKGKVKYRVHLVKGDWLDWVVCGNTYASTSLASGYAGIYGKAIDKIQIGIVE